MARKVSLLNARNRFKEHLIFTMGLKPVRLFCSECEAYIPGDMPWRCGYCGTANGSTIFYSFLNKCRTCKRKPKAVKCPNARCGALNHLDEDAVDMNPATAVTPLAPPEPIEQAIARRKLERLQEKEDKEHLILKARLDAELKRLVEDTNEKSPQAELEKDWTKQRAKRIGVREIMKRELAKNAETFRDDDDEREKADADVREWAETQSLL